MLSDIKGNSEYAGDYKSNIYKKSFVNFCLHFFALRILPEWSQSDNLTSCHMTIVVFILVTMSLKCVSFSQLKNTKWIWVISYISVLTHLVSWGHLPETMPLKFVQLKCVLHFYVQPMHYCLTKDCMAASVTPFVSVFKSLQ